jgi:hypothetical protein
MSPATSIVRRRRFRARVPRDLVAIVGRRELNRS